MAPLPLGFEIDIKNKLFQKRHNFLEHPVANSTDSLQSLFISAFTEDQARIIRHPLPLHRKNLTVYSVQLFYCMLHTQEPDCRGEQTQVPCRDCFRGY